MYWRLIDSKYLVYTDRWEDAKSSVIAKTFGEMVELAQGRVHHYLSDLYHDALWLREKIDGPMEFDWIARESGTFIGEAVQHIKLNEWPDARKYRFHIGNKDGRFVLDIWEATPDECDRPNVPDRYREAAAQGDEALREYVKAHKDLPVTECDSATKIAGCIEHPAPYLTTCTGAIQEDGTVQHDGDTCPQHENDDSYGGTVAFGGDKSLVDQLMETGVWKNPTPRNEVLTQTTKENGVSLHDLISNLEDKLNDLNGAKDEASEGIDSIENALQELEDVKSQLEEFVSDAEDAADKYQNAIDVLNDLPEVSLSVSVYADSVDIDVSFES